MLTPRHAVARALSHRLFGQHGVITRAEATAAGLSSSAIGRKLATGQWERVHPQVFRVAGSPSTTAQVAVAAARWAGDGAALSHRSALHLWGFPGATDVLEVITACRRDTRPGLRVHQVRTLPTESVTVRDGVPVTTLVRTIVDLASVLVGPALEEVIEFFVSRKLLTEKELDKAMAEDSARWVRGRPALRKCLLARLRRGGSGRALEDATDRALLRGGVDIPARDVLLTDSKGQVFRIPLAIPGRRVAVIPIDANNPQAYDPNRIAFHAALHEQDWTLRVVDFPKLLARPACHARPVLSLMRSPSPGSLAHLTWSELKVKFAAMQKEREARLAAKRPRKRKQVHLSQSTADR